MAGKMFKVLICDDSLLVREKLKENLLQIGEFAIAEADNGRDAFEIFRDFRPHLVFLDIVMPEKNGIEVLREMKAHDSNAKVVILSSSGTRTHLSQAIEAGAIEFIQKPWDISHLQTVISRVDKYSEEG